MSEEDELELDEEELELDIGLLERERNRCLDRIDEIDRQLRVKQQRLDEIRGAVTEAHKSG